MDYKKRIYISGAITNDPAYREHFERAEKILKKEGYIPVNPVKIGEKYVMDKCEKPEYGDFMRADLRALLDCDGIMYLPSAADSEGSKVEQAVAKSLNLLVVKIKAV